jgi:NAD-dependent SIR2 family protein deacetylase
MIDKIKKIINEADALIIFVGAGMGRDSGLPVFRGNDGFWEEYPALGKLGLNFESIASPQGFTDYTSEANMFYLHRQELYETIWPHNGFYEILKYAEKLKHKYFVVTSNVDEHFLKAGFDPERLYEVHGNINKWQCINYNCSQEHGVFTFNQCTSSTIEEQTIMHCPNCDSLARPNILMFGDWGWNSKDYDIQRDKFREYLNIIDYENIAILEIGAGNAIATMRDMALDTALSNRTKVIRINPDTTPEHETSRDYILNVEMSAEKGINFILS